MQCIIDFISTIQNWETGIHVLIILLALQQYFDLCFILETGYLILTYQFFLGFFVLTGRFFQWFDNALALSPIVYKVELIRKNTDNRFLVVLFALNC